MRYFTKQIHLFLLLGLCSFLAIAYVKPFTAPKEDARRISVLFLGAPIKNSAAHNPITRYQVIKKQLGAHGIDFSYSEDPAVAFKAETLSNYDVLVMYGNWAQHGDMPVEQSKALLDFVNNGGGFVPVHCASACYGKSDAFVNLVGGRFKSHKSGVFSPTNVKQTHPIMKGLKPVKAWDETYVHDRHAKDRVILQKRDNEPWSWIRTQGKGKVFYTASGHDHRVWDHPDFHDLLKKGILWSAGKASRASLKSLDIPEMKYAKARLPGYLKRKTIEQYQEPLSPQNSIKHAQVPAGFEIALFAHEPDIINPIAINWDEKGRAFVVETIDYPNQHHARNIGNDRIKICEDTDNDGRADKFTIFADKLSLATSLVHAYGGVICTNGTEILFLKDTDGDDKADIRKVLFKGFSMRDTHAGPSNLRWGYDGWIYATVGYSGFSGTVGNTKHSFRMGVFRFRINGNLETEKEGSDKTLQHISELEFLQSTTNNTWGLGITEQFDVLNSTANANASAYLTLPNADYKSAGLKQPRTPKADTNPTFFPSSSDIRQVDVHNGFTAAAGHAFYTADRFPAHYRNKVAFVCAPTGKLVAQFSIDRKGAGFRATQQPNNIYNSSDTWSAPVAAEVGPDGALWICDWYNIIIQHNPTPTKGSAGYNAKNGKGNAYVTPLRDKQHGRIYRVYPKGSLSKKRSIDSVEDAKKMLNEGGSLSQFWKISAQRKILDQATQGSISDTQKLELGNYLKKADKASVTQIYTLYALNQLDENTIIPFLKSPRPEIRKAAVKCAPKGSILESHFINGTTLIEKDPNVLLELLLAFSRSEPSEKIASALINLKVNGKDIGLRDAYAVAVRGQASAIIVQRARDYKGSALDKEVNILENASLDSVGGWLQKAYKGAKPKFIHSKNEGRNGSSCLKIEATASADCGWAMTLKVKPNQRYEFGGYIKTENLKVQRGPGVLFNRHTAEKSGALNKDQDWTKVSFTFQSGARQTSVLVHCLFGGYGGATGIAYYDDLFLYEKGPASSGETTENLLAHVNSKGSEAEKNNLAKKLKGIGSPYAESLLGRLNNKGAIVEVKARKHKINAAVHKRGKEFYNTTCIACHGDDGKGMANAFPPLDNSDWVSADPSKAVGVLIHGLQGPIKVNGKPYNSMMPPLANITDQEISDVLTYVRQAWSNDLAPVTLDQVKAARIKFQKQKQPLKAGDFK